MQGYCPDSTHSPQKLHTSQFTCTSMLFGFPPAAALGMALVLGHIIISFWSAAAAPLLLLQAGVKVVSYVLGRQLFDLLNLTLQTALFLGWLYVLVVPPIGSLPYFSVLLAVAWYSSGLGYLVSIVLPLQNALLGGIAVGLILGGVANGVQPPMHEMQVVNPLYLLDWLSYTR